MKKDLTITTQQKTMGRVDLLEQEYDVQVNNHGLDFVHEQAVRCSCNREVNGAGLPDCVNCLGVGYIFINPATIRGVIQAIGYDPKYMQWGSYDMGTARLTVRTLDLNRLGYFDRLTLQQGETIFTENTFPITRDIGAGTELSSLLTYAPLQVDKVFLFVDQSTPHTELFQFESDDVTPKDFTIDARKIKLSAALLAAFQAAGADKYYVGIRYRHHPEYVVMDIQKDIRNSNILSGNGPQEKLVKQPAYCIIKKSHYPLTSNGTAD